MLDEFRRRAVQAGLTARDWVLWLIEADQRLPTAVEWLEELRRQPSVISAADVVEREVIRDFLGLHADVMRTGRPIDGTVHLQATAYMSNTSSRISPSLLLVRGESATTCG